MSDADREFTNPCGGLDREIQDILETAIPTITVTDAPEEDQAYPYIVVGEQRMERANGRGDHGVDVVQEIEIHSAHRGKKELNSLAGQIIPRLLAVHHYDLSAEGRHLYGVQFEDFQTSRQVDGAKITRHATLRVTFFIDDA